MRDKFLIFENVRQAIIICVVLLLGFGLGNDLSASYARSEMMTGSQYFFTLRYVIYSVVGFLCMLLVGSKFDYHRLLSPRFLKLSGTGTIVLLLLVKVAGRVVNGSRRWLGAGPVSFQPSELAKVVAILIAAGILGEYLRRGQRVSLLQWPKAAPLAFALIAGGLVLIQPDMGTAAIIVGLMLYMYIIAGIPKQQIWGIAIVGLAGAAGIAVLAPYRLNRLKVWLNPFIDPQGAGYQMVQAKLAIGSGGLFGMHWGQGSSKFFYLPEAHTDFAFAVFCQEWGFLGALLLIALFTLLAYAFYRVAIRTKDRKGFLLTCGCSFLIIGQSVANMAMVTGLLPVIGVPLMFISYGGTSLVINFFCIGLILSVYRLEAAREIREERMAAGLPPEDRNGLRVVHRGEDGRRGR